MCTERDCGGPVRIIDKEKKRKEKYCARGVEVTAFLEMPNSGTAADSSWSAQIQGPVVSEG